MIITNWRTRAYFESCGFFFTRITFHTTKSIDRDLTGNIKLVDFSVTRKYLLIVFFNASIVNTLNLIEYKKKKKKRYEYVLCIAYK